MIEEYCSQGQTKGVDYILERRSLLFSNRNFETKLKIVNDSRPKLTPR